METFQSSSKKYLNPSSSRRVLLRSADELKYRSAESLFHSLKVIKQQSENTQQPDRAVPKGKFLEMMLKAKEGDTSGWKPTKE